MSLTYDEQFVVFNLVDIWDVVDGVMPEPDGDWQLHDETYIARLLPWNEDTQRARYVYEVAQRYSRLRRARAQVLLDQ